ncbi:MAG TPA: hypothetical protein VMF13_10330 [Luteitalea sp.]|nr:hypothetical protein [Luteitalea sp.]
MPAVARLVPVATVVLILVVGVDPPGGRKFERVTQGALKLMLPLVGARVTF